MPTIDFSAVQGLEPLPRGEYLGRVISAEEGISARSSQPKIDYRVEVIAPTEYAGRQFFDGISFHPDALYKAKQKLIGLGVIGKDFAGNLEAGVLIGREAAFLLDIEEGKELPEDEATEPGEKYPDRNRVKRIRPAEKFGLGNVPTSAATGLDSLEVPTEAVEASGRRTRRS